MSTKKSLIIGIVKAIRFTKQISLDFPIHQMYCYIYMIEYLTTVHVDYYLFSIRQFGQCKEKNRTQVECAFNK